MYRLDPKKIFADACSLNIRTDACLLMNFTRADRLDVSCTATLSAMSTSHELLS